MKPVFRILGLFVLFSLSTDLIAQDKIVIDDRASILNAELETLLQKKFLEKNLHLTNSVDFRNKCEYYFSTIVQAGRGYTLKVENCDNELLGSVFAGSNLESISNEEKAVIIFYNLWDIIESPTYPDAEAEVENQEQPYSLPANSEHDSRYFFAPSALPLKKRELYYNTLYFFSHDIQYGVSDRFTVGLGTTIIGLPFYLTAKYSIPIQENSYLAIGDLLMIGTYGTNFFGNLAYATYTYGTSHNNISIGAGHLYFNPGNNNNEISSSVVGNLSAIKRAGKYFYFLTENYLFNFQATENANRTTTLPDGSVMYQEAEYDVQRNIWYGLTGIRFVQKKNALVSFQFGLTHMLFLKSKVPAPYNSSSWNSSSFYDRTRMIAFPTFSFTRKFKL